MHYRVILLTHSDETLSFADSYASTTWENTELCIVNCGPNRTNAQAEALVVSTDGKAYDAVKASNLTIDTGKAITILPQFVGKDSDGDGIPDLVEQYGLKPDGTPIHSDPHLKDTDGDGLSDNEELGFVPLNSFLESAEAYMQHVSYRSDPNNPDTDGDGISDDKDGKPLVAADTRFELIDSIDYQPSVNWVDTRYQESQNCHDSLFPDYGPIEYTTLNSLILSLGASLTNPYFPVIGPVGTMFSSYMLAGFYEDIDGNPPYTNVNNVFNASTALMHYFSGLGTTVTYSEKDMCTMIASSSNNIDHLLRNITYSMQYAEQIAISEEKAFFVNSSDSPLKITCFDDKGDNCDSKLSDIALSDQYYSAHQGGNNARYCNSTHVDWHNTVGESLGSIVCEVKKTGSTYSMTYRYYMIDIYEWVQDPHGTVELDDIGSILHVYHHDGSAQQYLMNGFFEGTIIWEEGDSAYHKNVFEQIRNTIVSIEGEE